MKKTLIFIITIIAFFAIGSTVTAKVGEPRRPLCLQIKGTFYSNGWTGGDVQVGCGGDWGHALPPAKRASQSCTGETQVVSPGKKFTLTACSCHDTQGCLYIAKKLHVSKPFDKNHQSHVIIDIPLSDVAKFKNNKCSLTAGGSIVANLTGGKTKVCGTNGSTLIKNFKIKCNVPNTPTPTHTGTPTPTNTPTPTGVCVKPEPVLNVKITCPNCNNIVTPTPTIDENVNQDQGATQ